MCGSKYKFWQFSYLGLTGEQIQLFSLCIGDPWQASQLEAHQRSCIGFADIVLHRNYFRCHPIHPHCQYHFELATYHDCLEGSLITVQFRVHTHVVVNDARISTWI